MLVKLSFKARAKNRKKYSFNAEHQQAALNKGRKDFHGLGSNIVTPHHVIDAAVCIFMDEVTEMMLSTCLKVAQQTLRIIAERHLALFNDRAKALMLLIAKASVNEIDIESNKTSA